MGLTFSNDPITKIVQVEAVKLREKWLQFWRDCAKEDRLELETSEPSIENVISKIQEMDRTWKSRRGKGVGGRAATYFRRFCGTLDGHASLLKVLPEGSEYVSVFAGTLNAVIKVRLLKTSRPRSIRETTDV